MKKTHKRKRISHKDRVKSHRRKGRDIGRGRTKAKTKTRKGGSCGIKNLDSIAILGTMLLYGIASAIVGPFYFLAEIMNTPMTSINNLSRKAFKKEKGAIWHRPFYQLLFGPSQKKELNNKDFLLEKDLHIHQKVAIVSNDEDPEPELDDEGKVLADSKGNPKQKPFLDEKDFSPGIIEKLKNTFFSPSDYQKLKNNVFLLFDKIESIRATDAERKKDIHEYIKKIIDYQSLIKWYLIYDTIKTCDKYKKEEKTILKGVDVVTIVNPFYHPGNISYPERLSCIKKHLFQDELRNDIPEDKVCRVCCDTCTFKNSISRLAQNYISSGAWLLGLVALTSGFVGFAGILGSTGLGSSLGIASGMASTVGAGASVASTGIATGVSAVTGIGAASSNVISILSACLSGGAGVLVGGAAIYNMMKKTNYSSIAKKMLDAYFKYIKITNSEILQSEKLINAIPMVEYKIDDSKKTVINSNIINILKKLSVTSTFQADTEEKKAVIERFNRFMCKYEIDQMIDARIAQLYEEKKKKNSNPVQLLEFISTGKASGLDNLNVSNVLQKTKDILTTSVDIEQKTKS